ncbi:S8 family serine peptidase [Kribbella sandramycini]
MAGAAVVGTAALVSTAALAGGGAQAAQPAAAAAKPAVAKPEPAKVVTLITGDRVVVRPGQAPTVTAGKGRAGMVFKTSRERGRLRVLPVDVLAAVKSGRLDRRFFDVTGLIEMGYDDARTKATPVLLPAAGVQLRSTLPGATMPRPIGTSGLAAATVDKAAGGAFFASLSRGLRSRSAGTIWLDAKRRTQLDKSVPQIGAPAAWKAGFTGKGVPVAVLDSGIDANHPDFKGLVVGGKNFTKDPAGDQLGHGTHVASTIAGSGAASKGKYKGVAPGARLLDGKICDGEGSCPDSAILAGMEWAAVEQKARVINMSLGIYDEPGLDPIEAALDRLTAKTGALFVVAAGNEGPDGQTVRSPGTAVSALTVGAVDKQDALADLSSRGPLLEGVGIKPDVMGPGVDIVAARAKGTNEGEPVGENYVMASGTSMATPHVAGAAAILAQQHPKWKAAELKAALMSTGKVIKAATVFEQGAGRIDVARAITGSVVSVPGSIDFGTALWPHTDDKPVAKQLTYRNLGAKAVTLSLQASSITGSAAGPESAFKLSAAKLTVPANGTAAVTVTSDTNHRGPDGLYSGRVVATAPGVSIGTPLAVEKEIESYDVSVRHLMLDGKGTDKNFTRLYSLTKPLAIDITTDANGAAKVRIPKDKYFVESILGDTSTRVYQLIWPNLSIGRAMKLDVDARKTKPIKVTLPRKNTALIKAEFEYLRKGANDLEVEGGMEVEGNPDNLWVGSMGAAAPLDKFHVTSNSRWVVQRKPGDNRNAPYDYNLVQNRRGSYYTGYRRVVRESDLARIDSKYAADAVGGLLSDERFGWVPGLDQSTAGISTFYNAPATATHFVEINAGTGPMHWYGAATYSVIEGEEVYLPLMLNSTGPKLKPGSRYAEQWGRSVANAALDAGDGVYRQGNELDVLVFPVSDADGHLGTSLAGSDSETTKVFHNGKLLNWSSVAGQINIPAVPAAKAAYRIEVSIKRSKMQLATQVDHVWSFDSQDTGDVKEILPLRDVHFTPAVDQQNAVARTATTTLPFRIVNAQNAKPAGITAVAVDVSGDGGKTWQRTAVTKLADGSYQAVVKTPAGKTISLRSSVKDSAGIVSAQKVLHAYRIR